MATSEKLSLEPEFLERWPCTIIGFGLSKKYSYRVYLALLISFYTYFLLMAVEAIYLVIPDVNNCIAAISMFMSVNWIIFALFLRLATARYLEEMIDMIKIGIYRYENEESGEAEDKIVRIVHRDYTRRANNLVGIYIASYISVMFGSPVIGYLFEKEDLKSHMDAVVNPFLPHLFYSPFDTTTGMGYTAAYFMDLVYWLLACLTTVYTIKLNMIGISQLVLQLKILNHSLENIQRRALMLYKKRVKSPTLQDAVDIKKFNDCLHSCLKSNIQHHQNLLRYTHVLQPYVSSTLLSIFSAFVVVIYAALLYLLLLKQPISVRMKYIGMFVSEQFCTFCICLFGEDVITESTVLFQNLYAIPWFQFDRDFKQTLRIMMTHVRQPMRHRAYFLAASASMESYGELIKATYSLTNLMVPSQKK